MRVLNLVPSSRSRFFRQQVSVLAEAGVESDTLAVSNERRIEDGEVDRRSVFDYVRHAGETFGRSFGPYDLIHANYGLTAPAALAQPNLPVVVSLWGTDLMGRFGPVSAACAVRADEVIVMSPEMADRLDCDPHVIPHGIDLDRFEPAPREAARESLGWREDARHVLFPYPPAREVKDYPRARRVVDAARAELDVPVELQVVNGVPHDEMPTYMNAADALLVTSKREGSPNAVKEALACNLPVVSTDVGDVTARLDGVSPSAVERTDEALADALAGILASRERSNGREAAREVSVTRTNARLRDVYGVALDGSR